MVTELVTEIKTKKIVLDEPTTKEYSIIIDGIIEIASKVDEKIFFDGLIKKK